MRLRLLLGRRFLAADGPLLLRLGKVYYKVSYGPVTKTVKCWYYDDEGQKKYRKWEKNGRLINLGTIMRKIRKNVSVLHDPFASQKSKRGREFVVLVKGGKKR